MSHKILIIDDDRDVYDTLAIRLESFGYQMAWAKNGTEGYAQAKAQKPDLIFLDFNMENESGLDVLRTLKKDPSEEIKKIPVVMLTGREEFQKACLDSGAAGYITKPFDIFGLKEILAKYIPA